MDDTIGFESDAVLLLGAGASHEAGIPLMQSIVDEFVQQLGEDDRVEMEGLLTRLRPAAVDGVVDLELVLEALDRIPTLGSDLTAILVGIRGGDDSANLEGLQQLGPQLREYLRRRVCEDVTPKRTGYLRPLLMFARQFGTLDVFTLNYDTTIEMVADSERIDWVDGFANSWDAGTLPAASGEPARPVIRLFKLHGSITWYQRSEYRYIRIPVLPEPALKYFDHEDLEQAMIYPAANKVVQSGIFAELFAFLRTALSEVKVAVVIGYSFRDAHVMQLLDEALVRSRRLFLLIVDPSADELRIKVMNLRSAPERCLAITKTAGEALAGDLLLTTVNTIIQAQQQLASAEASKPGNFILAKRSYAQAIYLYRTIKHVDGIRSIVALDETSNPFKSGNQQDAHLLRDLPTCLWFALTTPVARSSWWSMAASLLHWFEEDVSQVRGVPVTAHAAPEGTNQSTIGLSATDAALSSDIAREAARQIPGDSLIKRYLNQLADQLGQLSQWRFGEGVPVMPDEAVERYNASPACMAAVALGRAETFPTFDLQNRLDAVILPTFR